MTTQDYTDQAGSDFPATDPVFATLLAELEWLGEEGAQLTRIGLAELQRTIRRIGFGDGSGAIDISATATPSGLTVILEDSGLPLTGQSDLPILELAFDQVTYGQVLGRNQWILRRFAPRVPGSRLRAAPPLPRGRHTGAHLRSEDLLHAS